MRPAEAGEAVARERVDAPVTPGQLTPAHFFSDDDSRLFRQRWTQVQSGFIDRPQETVEQADALLGDVLERLSRGLADERSELAARWRGGADRKADTEDLRLAVQGYRSLLERLVGGGH